LDPDNGRNRGKILALETRRTISWWEAVNKHGKHWVAVAKLVPERVASVVNDESTFGSTKEQAVNSPKPLEPEQGTWYYKQ
jgi:alkylated DNA nucleotide flippase Atl1